MCDFQVIKKQHRHEQLIAYGIGVALIIYFLQNGWGSWGMGVTSDYALDLTDALRAFQGDKPYKDYLPSYGMLHIILVAPLYKIGKLFFPCYWILTALLIVIQLFLIIHCAIRRISRVWLITFIFLYVNTVAFAPTNSKFVLGFSQSGFLGSILWIFILTLLWRKRRTFFHIFMAGLLLGLEPYTKIDMGITSIIIFLMLILIYLKGRPLKWVIHIFGFALSWLLCYLGLVFYGSEPRLIYESAIEGFGQATLIHDHILSIYFLMLAIFGLVIGCGLCFSKSRFFILKLQRNMGPIFIWMLPIAIIIDIFRSLHQGPIKNLVTLNYLWAFIWIMITARLLSTSFRYGIACMIRKIPIPILLMIIISGMGLMRVAITGWYPLNYYQPILLILAILWFASRPFPLAPWKRLSFACLLFICLLLQTGHVLKSQNKHRCTFVDTPYGKVGVSLDDQSLYDLDRILVLCKAAPNGESLLTTYEPSFHLFTGFRYAEFYTYFQRLAFSGQYRKMREEESLDFFKKRTPFYVLKEVERATFSKKFGVDYGIAINQWIESNYNIIYRSNPVSITQYILYQKRI